MGEREFLLNELMRAAGRFTERSKKLDNISKIYSYIRLTVFFTGLIIIFYLFLSGKGTSAWITILLLAVPFGLLTQKQNIIDFALKRNDLWIKIKKLHIARMKTDWVNIPYSGILEPDSQHPFESDLGISGKYSLLHLIDYSKSVQGKARISEWLLNRNPDVETINSRQNIVKELIPLTKFRDKLLLSSSLVSSKALDGEKIIEQLDKVQDIGKIRNILLILLLLTPINVSLFVLYIFGYIHAWFIIPVFLYLWIFYFNNKFIGGIYDKSLELEENAGKFITVFEFLEKYNYARNIHLKKLCNSFIINRPSESFRRIKRIILAMGFTQNPFYFLLLNIIFPWNYWFALKFEYLKKDIYVSINDWLETWYSLEVLVSFAFIKYLNPNYTFPLVRGTATDTILNMNEAAIGNNGIANLPVLRAVNLSHPLIPYDKNVSNSFTLHDIGETIIITGSNMSGKSTFLKTIGTNMALAYAGAPVAASVMELGSFRLFTCIKINDSVTDGISYFYAEVKRLKGLLDEIKEENSLPLFYLIDEIFRGTNNYERLIGSRSYIKTLTGLKGCGIISTHDLELVKLEQEINQIHNYHFREEAEGGKMIFDYKLRTGPCPTTNALKIMMNEGLPVII